MSFRLLKASAKVRRRATRPTIVKAYRNALSSSTSVPDDLPLSGIRVLELGQLIAGPFAGQLLAHFGAEVIKVEPPNVGDPLRIWRELDIDGTSPWFRSIARNKKSIAIDLRKEEGRDLVRQLAIKSDVLLENFRPGTLEKWSLDPASIHPYNPSLIYTRVSGYGQTGPWASRPGYASVCEAESGFRYINGFPTKDGTGELDGPPVRPNISLGDSVAGLHAAFGTVLALLRRHKKMYQGKASGQIVDVSIMESMLNLMEGIIPEYDRKGKIRGPSGSSVTGIVPTNAYPCRSTPRDSSTATPTPTYIVIGANGDTIYNRLMHAISRPDLTGPAYQHNQHRVERQAVIEEAIAQWTSEKTVDQVTETMNAAGVPVGRVVNVSDIIENEHLKERGAVESVWVPELGADVKSPEAGEDRGEAGEERKGWNVRMQAIAPRLEGCDLKTRWAGPDLGFHTDEILKDDLGLSEEQVRSLRANGIVG